MRGHFQATHRLAAEGLVERIRELDDGAVFVLTDKGREALA